MRALLRPALALLGLASLLTGVAYPALVTLLAQFAFPHQANGSVLESGDAVLGSALIGQAFSGAGHLWSRPSATGPVPYHGASSSGSNLGPANPALHAAVAERARRAGGGADRPVPADLVTASASGLDPHVSPAGARLQVPRIAAARGLPPEAVQAAIDRHTEGRTLGVLGEPRVNVLLVNLDLDGRLPAPRPR